MDLVVDAERRLPAICLKCGAKKHIVRRNEKLTAASASQGFGAVGGVCGVMVARAMREDPVAGALVLGGSLVGAIIVGWAFHAHAPKVSLAIPLCRECNVRWQSGVKARHAILAGLCGSGAFLAYGFFAQDTFGYVVGGALFAAILIAAVAFRLRDRFVFASAIQGSRAVLKGVSDEARAAIEKRYLSPTS
jgi:hypothetical protein